MLQFSPVSRNLIFICVAVFLLQLFVGQRVTMLLELYPIGSPYFRPYQLFSYMFAHGDFSHIFFNMLMLAFTAPMLEMIWGQQRLLIYYVATGIGAALIYAAVEYFLHPFGGRPMIGASGAIYGLLMAFGLLMPDREVRLLIPPVAIKAKYLVFILGGITFLFGGSNVAHAAHFGGAFVGFLMIKVFRF
ncbi:MAG TPA: rhomboid family intramembrane serine protease [Cyclobacteriaceae bacterium]|nr:rhomboid family intramembrane serine protease [Cyclobacteriaceae bacterium]